MKHLNEVIPGIIWQDKRDIYNNQLRQNKILRDAKFGIKELNI